MSTLPKSKLIPVVLLVVALLALPAAANATLAYSKGFQHAHLYYAEDNGKGAHKFGPGRDPHVSPNGELIVFEGETRQGGEMKLYSVATGKTKTLLTNWRESFVLFAWSPDSTMVAALRGPLSGPFTLVLINVETGKQRKVAKGYFTGASFSPESDEIVYAVSKSPDYPPQSNVYRYAIGGAAPVALSHNHASAYPLWGPTGQIVFVRQLGAKQRRYGPKFELYQMNEEGKRISRLTQTKVSPLSQGLTPLAWSESGKQLLAEFGGEDQSYAVAVNAVTGAQKALTDNPEMGFIGAGLSPDGKTVLGTTGLGFGPHPHPNVVTVPFKGGKEKVLVKGAFEPSWGG
ncbi:MAG TPA: hypothetical protein VHV53_07670 [Solirubrobacterales bacterium]|jgi:Tol biopolymer transport system component|nr:hypothetical protein [Solirubrobacterales bacterium]